jgi:uncharacterized protein YeaO (DUF488 family)
MIKVKRIYETATYSDGYRILVDRLWPRNMTKEHAAIGIWMKDLAPSTELRKWFNHEVEKWPEFEQKYKAELKAKQQYLQQLRQLEKEHGTITLLYAAKDEKHNNVKVIVEWLQ